MAWYNPFSWTASTKDAEKISIPTYATSSRQGETPFAFIAAGIEDIVKNTENMRKTQDYSNKFDLFEDKCNYVHVDTTTLKIIINT